MASTLAQSSLMLWLALACLSTSLARGTPALERIRGGRKVEAGETPYQISVQLENGGHWCGASLVMIDGIQCGISAAHCFSRLPADAVLYAVAGDLDLQDISGSEQWRRVTRVVSHPDFDFSHLANDVALVLFEDQFVLNKNVSIIDVAQDRNYVDEKLLVTGWGMETPSSPLAQHLQLVELEPVDFQTCKRIYSEDVANITIVPSMLCAGRIGALESPCRGDSGGPAKGVRSGLLIGIVSFGIGDGCRYAEFPAVFTKVAYFTQWLTEEINIFKKGIGHGNSTSALAA